MGRVIEKIEHITPQRSRGLKRGCSASKEPVMMPAGDRGPLDQHENQRERQRFFLRRDFME
jgi:hypothetical protein